MRTVSRTLLGYGWRKAALVATGLGVGVVGGFVGSLLKEREALGAACTSAILHPGEDAVSTRRIAAPRLASAGQTGRPLEMRA